MIFKDNSHAFLLLFRKVVADVYWLEPQTRRKDETAEQFAARVQVIMYSFSPKRGRNLICDLINTLNVKLQTQDVELITTLTHLFSCQRNHEKSFKFKRENTC